MRKAIKILYLLMMLVLLMCCSFQKKYEIKNSYKNYNYVESGTEDIFDPIGYIEHGYFALEPNEVLKRNRMLWLRDCSKYGEDDTIYTLLYRCWNIGGLGIEYSEHLNFENNELVRIDYDYEFQDETEGKEFFILLCERMMKISEEPAWRGIWQESSSESVNRDNYKEIPIINAASYLRDDEIEVYLYQYEIDLKNKYYDENDTNKGYRPFDRSSIKVDLEEDMILKEATVVSISYRVLSQAESGLKNNKVHVTLMIEK